MKDLFSVTSGAHCINLFINAHRQRAIGVRDHRDDLGRSGRKDSLSIPNNANSELDASMQVTSKEVLILVWHQFL